MSKDYLEAFGTIVSLLTNDRTGTVMGSKELSVIEQALLELQYIKEANPSEALKCLESIKDALWDDDFHYQRHSKLLDTIEQALLKAQEPKHYLKWEDLDFKEEEQTMKVRMGDRNYTLIYHKWFMLGKWYYGVELRNEETLDIIDHIRGKLFNDLHLEVVENE